MTPERKAELQKEFDEWLATPAGQAFLKRLQNLTWPKWLPRLADGRINWQAFEREAARRGIIGATFWESTPAEVQLAIEGADWRDQRNMNLLADALRPPEDRIDREIRRLFNEGLTDIGIANKVLLGESAVKQRRHKLGLLRRPART